MKLLNILKSFEANYMKMRRWQGDIIRHFTVKNPQQGDSEKNFESTRNIKKSEKKDVKEKMVKPIMTRMYFFHPFCNLSAVHKNLNFL